MTVSARTQFLAPWLGLLFLSAAAAQDAESTPSWGDFAVGANQAWMDNDYGHDLMASFKEASWDRLLARCHKSGVRVLRIWLFEDMEGIQYDPQDNITGIAPEFLKNLDRISALAAKHQVAIYTALHDGNLVKCRTTERQRKIFTNVDGQGDAFRTKVLLPVLQVLTKRPRWLFAIDMVNEIQGCVRKGGWTGCHQCKRRHQVFRNGWNGARAYFKTTAAFIHKHAPKIKVSASSGWGWAGSDILIGRYDDVGLDFYDVHFYNHGWFPMGRSLVRHARRKGIPILVGECAPGKIFSWAKKTDYFAGHQAQVSTRFLTRAKELGFSGVLFWRLEDPDLRFSLTEGEKDRPALKALHEFSKTIPRPQGN